MRNFSSWHQGEKDRLQKEEQHYRGESKESLAKITDIGKRISGLESERDELDKKRKSLPT